MYEQIERHEEEEDGEEGDDDEDLYPLSGLAELYMGETKDEGEDDDKEEFKVDSETVFNQVDVQNTSLVTAVKKTIRKLSKKIEKNSDFENGEEEEMLPDEAFGETEVDNETLMEERKKL